MRTLRITGVTIYSGAELIGVTSFHDGTALNPDQLRAMATHISDFHHQHGYFVAQTYFPAQNIRDANLRIEGMEARYRNISVRNQSNVPVTLIKSYRLRTS